MQRVLFVSLLLAGAVLSGCQQSSASAKNVSDEKPSAPKKIELRDGENRPVSLEPTASVAYVPESSPSLNVNPSAATEQPTSEAAILPPPPKKKNAPIDGAVTEDLGPCNGRGVAGYATINGEKKPICGQDPSTAYYNDYGYGYSSGSRYSSRYRSNPYSTQYRRTYVYRP